MYLKHTSHLDKLKQHIQSLAKADVHNHLHLGGTQQRVKEIYPNNNLVFPQSYNGLDGMIDFIYSNLDKVMVTGDDVITFFKIAIESSIDDNITLLEASIDIGLAKFFNNSIDKVIEIVRALKEHYKTQIDFRPDIGINKDLPKSKVYSDGVKCVESGEFNGIDLYGKEANQDLAPFSKLYDMAKDHGIKTKVHIGEFSDHRTIENAIKILRPNEIQHGITAVNSKHTMDLILKHNIRLNICPASNLALGAIPSIEAHPLRTLYDYGIKLTINTDDLILFNTTITDEFIYLLEHHMFSFEELNEIRMNAFN